MRKSETGVALPAIRTYHKTVSIYQKQRQRSVFVERVKQEIGQEGEYEAMDNSTLGQQQRKLKLLLRQFNDQSHLILANFIEAPPRPTQSKSFTSSVAELKVREKQITNKQKIINQCDWQLKQLQSRCQNLKYMTREEMQKQIDHILLEMESLRTENKQLARGVTLNGLNICKGQNFTKIKEMEYEKAQLENKKMQLKLSTDEVERQTLLLRESITKTEKQIIEAEGNYKQALANQNQVALSQKLKQDYKQKKKSYETMKQKYEQSNAGLKQKYLNKLRQLDQIHCVCKKNNDQLSKSEEMVQKSKKQMIILEHEFSALKHRGMTLQLLSSRNK